MPVFMTGIFAVCGGFFFFMSSTTYTWSSITFWNAEQAYVGTPIEFSFESKNLPPVGLLTFSGGAYYTKALEAQSTQGQFAPLVSSAPHGYWSGALVTKFGNPINVKKISKINKNKIPGLQGWKNDPSDAALQDLLESGFNYSVGPGWDKIVGGFSELSPSEFSGSLPPAGHGYFIDSPSTPSIDDIPNTAAPSKIPAYVALSPALLAVARSALIPALSVTPQSVALLGIGALALTIAGDTPEKPSTPDTIQEQQEFYWAPSDYNPDTEPLTDIDVTVPPQTDISKYDNLLNKIANDPDFPVTRRIVDEIAEKIIVEGKKALQATGNPDLEAINIYIPEPMKKDIGQHIIAKAKALRTTPSQGGINQGQSDYNATVVNTLPEIVDKLKEGIKLVPEPDKPIPKKVTDPDDLYDPADGSIPELPNEGEGYGNLGEAQADIPTAIRESTHSMAISMRGKPAPIPGGAGGIIGLIPAIIDLAEIIDRRFNPDDPENPSNACPCITKEDYQELIELANTKLESTLDKYFLKDNKSVFDNLSLYTPDWLIKFFSRFFSVRKFIVSRNADTSPVYATNENIALLENETIDELYPNIADTVGTMKIDVDDIIDIDEIEGDY